MFMVYNTLTGQSFETDAPLQKIIDGACAYAESHATSLRTPSIHISQNGRAIVSVALRNTPYNGMVAVARWHA